jgi:F-type H+-transporting ATPase subunit epsilon
VRLLLTVPTGTLVDEPVTKVLAESAEGGFCLLPRHLDLATVLVPGLLTFVRASGDEEVVVAVDHGVLAKVGADVRVACQRAYVAGDLEEAARTVRERFYVQSEREKRARSTLARLESDVVRRLGELRGRHGA